MITVITQQGKREEIIFQAELCDPLNVGEYVRAYCHIHGSDHQRSLSINKATGWGHCFNATCNATVIVAEWNPTIAAHLLQNPESYEQLPTTPYVPHAAHERLPLAIQPVLLHVPKKTPKWQQDELKMLQSLEGRMQGALA